MPDTARAQRALTIEEIAALTRAKPRAGDPLDRRISNIAPLDTAVAADISFLDKPKFLDALAVTRAGACFISPRFEAQAPPGLAVLVTPEPYRTFVAVTRALFPEALRPSSLFGVKGRSKDAHVHASARLEANVTVDPLAVIGADAEIGAGVTIQHALIGDRVIIHPGARIGQDGFGYLPTPQGHQKIPQTRRVIVQDDVEIGANSTIDRGSSRDTIIGEGTKIDNLVQIGHNCTIGRHCIITSQTGISGSVKVGDYVMMGGQVGIADHYTIGDGAMLAARSGVITDVPAGARYNGWPAQPARDWLRGVAWLRRMARGAGKPEGDDE
ncbi:MAG TPA: UDP-3-O-(3-hydroxymyristoyl)glucosamine N-acyltransferase [Xanthobacteraceae bacterium]|nr:UDP-3-O-(3-hydroxymyristoyl)glucosamine N-acyltransferase [Xanthobacteraceae bacterium]